MRPAASRGFVEAQSAELGRSGDPVRGERSTVSATWLGGFPRDPTREAPLARIPTWRLPAFPTWRLPASDPGLTGVLACLKEASLATRRSVKWGRTRTGSLPATMTR